MLKSHKIHHPHFLILLFILAIGAGFILFFTFDRYLQITAVLATSLSYILWGILHHYKHKDLDLEVALEYLLIALFGAAILISIILKA